MSIETETNETAEEPDEPDAGEDDEATEAAEELDAAGESWGPRPGESSRAYAAFCQYRDAGAGRSLRKVAQLLRKSSTLLSRWSRAQAWQERCVAFDAHRNALLRREIEAAWLRDSRRLAGLKTTVLDRLESALGALDTRPLTLPAWARAFATVVATDTALMNNLGAALGGREQPAGAQTADETEQNLDDVGLRIAAEETLLRLDRRGAI